MKEEFARELQLFLEHFEKTMADFLKSKGAVDVTWVHDPEMVSEHQIRGNCASQADCGASRCKPHVNPCSYDVCIKLHSCGSQCQVGDSCKIRYCHGRCTTGRA